MSEPVLTTMPMASTITPAPGMHGTPSVRSSRSRRRRVRFTSHPPEANKKAQQGDAAAPSADTLDSPATAGTDADRRARIPLRATASEFRMTAATTAIPSKPLRATAPAFVFNANASASATTARPPPSTTTSSSPAPPSLVEQQLVRAQKDNAMLWEQLSMAQAQAAQQQARLECTHASLLEEGGRCAALRTQLAQAITSQQAMHEQLQKALLQEKHARAELEQMRFMEKRAQDELATMKTQAMLASEMHARDDA